MLKGSKKRKRLNKGIKKRREKWVEKMRWCGQQKSKHTFSHFISVINHISSSSGLIYQQKQQQGQQRDKRG